MRKKCTYVEEEEETDEVEEIETTSGKTGTEEVIAEG